MAGGEIERNDESFKTVNHSIGVRRRTPATGLEHPDVLRRHAACDLGPRPSAAPAEPDEHVHRTNTFTGRHDPFILRPQLSTENASSLEPRGRAAISREHAGEFRRVMEEPARRPALTCCFVAAPTGFEPVPPP